MKKEKRKNKVKTTCLKFGIQRKQNKIDNSDSDVS